MAISNCITTSICEQSILNNIVDSCDNPMFSGIEQVAVIINKGDIQKVVTDGSNHRIVTDIVLGQDGQGNQKYAFSVINARNNPYQGTSTSVVVGDYKNTFTRTVSLFVPMDGAKVSKEILDPMANGRFVVIMQNQFVNDENDNEYQIYGIDKGLKVSEMTQTKYENNDYWLITFTEEEVPNSGRWLKHEEYNDATSGIGEPTWVDNHYHFAAGFDVYPQDIHDGMKDPMSGDDTTYYGAVVKTQDTNYLILFEGYDPAQPMLINIHKAYTFTDTGDYICTLFEPAN